MIEVKCIGSCASKVVLIYFFLIPVLISVVAAFYTLDKTIIVQSDAGICFFKIIQKTQLLMIYYEVIKAENNEPVIIFKLTAPPSGRKYNGHKLFQKRRLNKGKLNKRDMFENYYNYVSPRIDSVRNDDDESNSELRHLRDMDGEDRLEALLRRFSFRADQNNQEQCRRVRRRRSHGNDNDVINSRSRAASHIIQTNVTGDYRFCFINNFKNKGYKIVFFNISLFSQQPEKTIHDIESRLRQRLVGLYSRGRLFTNEGYPYKPSEIIMKNPEFFLSISNSKPINRPEDLPFTWTPNSF